MIARQNESADAIDVVIRSGEEVLARLEALPTPGASGAAAVDPAADRPGEQRGQPEDR